MIGMDQYEYVRTAQRVYGKSIRQIAGEADHCRQTIRKVLKGEVPRCKGQEQQAYPVLDSYLEIIEGWLEADKSPEKAASYSPQDLSSTC